jgi:hypothetical protein
LKKHQQKMFNQALGDLFRRLRAGGAVRIFEADKPDDSARRLPICWGRESLVRIVVYVKGKFPLQETIGVGLTESAVDLNVVKRHEPDESAEPFSTTADFQFREGRSVQRRPY